MAQQGDTTDIHIRLWEGANDPAANYISVRPEGASWRDFSTVRVALDDGVSSNGRYRYGDVTVNVAPEGPGGWQVPVAIRVWERVSDPAVNYISVRPEGASWNDFGTVRVQLDGVSSSGRYRFGDVTVNVTLPSPDPTPTPTPTPPPTPAIDLESMPPNFKVAFIGDQGLGSDSRAVLDMIRREGADMVLHSGDFDYYDDPDGWDEQINQTLGDDFPYFASIGNHDLLAWDGYQKKLEERLARISGARCTGDLGVNSFCTYRGLFFVLSGVGTIDSGRASYIREALESEEARDSIWRRQERLGRVGTVRRLPQSRGDHRHRPRTLVFAHAPDG